MQKTTVVRQDDPESGVRVGDVVVEDESSPVRYTLHRALPDSIGARLVSSGSLPRPTRVPSVLRLVLTLALLAV